MRMTREQADVLAFFMEKNKDEPDVTISGYEAEYYGVGLKEPQAKLSFGFAESRITCYDDGKWEEWTQSRIVPSSLVSEGEGVP